MIVAIDPNELNKLKFKLTSEKSHYVLQSSMLKGLETRIGDLGKKISDIDETYTVYENLKTEITKRIDSLEETSVCIKEIKKDTRVVKKIDHALKKLEYVRGQLSSALSTAQSDYETTSAEVAQYKKNIDSIQKKIDQFQKGPHCEMEGTILY